MVDLQTVFRYLDDLRKSGVVSMFGAGEYLRDEFEMGRAANRYVREELGRVGSITGRIVLRTEALVLVRARDGGRDFAMRLTRPESARLSASMYVDDGWLVTEDWLDADDYFRNGGSEGVE